MAMRETIGIVAPVPKDEWSNETVYQPLNIVRNNGTTYIAKKGSEGIEPGVSADWKEYWSEIVKDGDGGIQGVKAANVELKPDQNGVVNIPVASDNGESDAGGPYQYGLVTANPAYGTAIIDEGTLSIQCASNQQITERASYYSPLVPATLDYSVKAAMCDGKGPPWTDAEKNGAWSRSTIVKTTLDSVLVANARYDLGRKIQESVTLTLPDVAISMQEIFIAFRSGETATSLNITSNYAGDTSYLPSANCIVELSFLFVTGVWVLFTKETDLPNDDEVSWRDVQTAVRLGLADKSFSVGDQLIANKNEEALTFDILDFDKHTPSDKTLKNSLALGLHNIYTYGTIPFSAPQLMYYTENGLPTGNYKFTLNHATYDGGTQYDGTYMFKLTHPIPADGGFRHINIGGYKGNYTQSDVVGNYITTYGARPGRSEVEIGVTVSVWDETTDCTDLGTFTAQSLTYYTENDEINGGKRNFIERQAYGSNRWRDSVYRQWLNSDADAVPPTDTTTVSNWWKPATVFDRVPGGAKLAGFLNGLDSEFVAVLGAVEVKTALCNCDRVGGATYDITYDKVWLQSMTEIFGSNNNGVAEGSQLSYWVGATAADRIKYDGLTAFYWWLRSSRSPSPAGVRTVNLSGVLGNDIALSTGSVVPACCIV